ncbi:hypothetical protein N9293_01145 [Planctomycetota bacterium]|nr:hypothetical protein [Planctomycetota bacterium]
MSLPSTTDEPRSNPSPGKAERSSVTLLVDREWFPYRVLLLCVLAEVAIVALDYFVNYGRATEIGDVRKMFSTSSEEGLGSYFAVSQTLLVAVTLGLLTWVKRASGASRWIWGGWLVLALFFAYMSVDDGVKIHERMGTVYKVLRERSSLPVSEYPSYFWQILFLPFFGVMGLFMLAFLWVQLEERRSRALLVLALSLLVLAVGLDFVEGLSKNHPANLYTMILDRWDLEEYTRGRFGRSGFDTLRHFSKSIEEIFMEALANSLIWYITLRHLVRSWSEIRVQFVDGPAAGSAEPGVPEASSGE